MIQHRNLKTNQVFFWVNNVYKRSESVTFVIADLPGDIFGTAGCSSAAAQQHKMTEKDVSPPVSSGTERGNFATVASS